MTGYCRWIYADGTYRVGFRTKHGWNGTVKDYDPDGKLVKEGEIKNN